MMYREKQEHGLCDATLLIHEERKDKPKKNQIISKDGALIIRIWNCASRCTDSAYNIRYELSNTIIIFQLLRIYFLL